MGVNESALPRLGKIPPDVFEGLIKPRLGAKSSSVLVGPRNGVDVGIVEIGEQAVALTTDPFFIVPQYGWEHAAWFAVHILASDLATSGFAPRFITIDLNLPPAMKAEELEAMWNVTHKTCEELGIAVVTGHTARYEGCNYPMVGGATCVGFGPKDAYVTPEMARVGDVVIVTKGPAIEAAGLFAVTFPDRVAEAYGDDFARSAEKLFNLMSVVEDARVAASVGVRDEGVTTMHDATECGLIGGLFEVAQASNVGMRIYRDKIKIDDRVKKICELFSINPYISISEGTLILTARPDSADKILSRLRENGIVAMAIGDVLSEKSGIVMVEHSGVERKIEHPVTDPFWEAFGKAIAKS